MFWCRAGQKVVEADKPGGRERALEALSANWSRASKSRDRGESTDVGLK